MARFVTPVLDLRRLSPPQPMQRILEALEQLPRGEHLIAMTPLHPAPLLEMLDADGFAYRTQCLAMNHCWLAICHHEFAATLADIPTPDTR